MYREREWEEREWEERERERERERKVFFIILLDNLYYFIKL